MNSTAIWQLPQLPYGSCHNCRMAVATTAVWQLPQLPYGSCHNCRMAVATNCLLLQSSPQTASTAALAVIPVMLLPQTTSYRSQLPKLPQQQLTVIPVMLRSPIRLNFLFSPTKIKRKKVEFIPPPTFMDEFIPPPTWDEISSILRLLSPNDLYLLRPMRINYLPQIISKST